MRSDLIVLFGVCFDIVVDLIDCDESVAVVVMEK
jgi:hypothetical protein